MARPFTGHDIEEALVERVDRVSQEFLADRALGAGLLAREMQDAGAEGNLPDLFAVQEHRKVVPGGAHRHPGCPHEFPETLARLCLNQV